MSEPLIVVLEKRPHWTPELQRQFLSEKVRVRLVTSSAALSELADDASVVLLAIDGAERECLQVMTDLITCRRQVATIAIGSRRTAELENAFRELGVHVFFADHIMGQDVAAACRRQLALAT